MNNVYKKDGKMQVKYEDTLRQLASNYNFENGRYHFKSWTGSRRHMTLLTALYDRAITLLNVFNIEYKLGNDAPRGGATGDYIEISDRSFKLLQAKYKEIRELK